MGRNCHKCENRCGCASYSGSVPANPSLCHTHDFYLKGKHGCKKFSITVCDGATGAAGTGGTGFTGPTGVTGPLGPVVAAIAADDTLFSPLRNVKSPVRICFPWWFFSSRVVRGSQWGLPSSPQRHYW